MHADRVGGLIPTHAGKTTVTMRARSTSRAHPRPRGDNAANSRQSSLVTGSSPLTRGKRQQDRHRQAAPRLIPAHTGKTAARDRQARPNWAHPRSRGENPLITAATVISWGSSPLTRGKPGPSARRFRGGRLIPAHAGKTRLRSPWARRCRAHPRSRGENWSAPKLAVGQSGSSPLTRGKLHSCSSFELHAGLIPAHAGKTPRTPWRRRRSRAHPRSRGENFAI